MWSPTRLKDGTEVAGGLGYGISPGGRYVSHQGRWLTGYSSHFQRFLKERVTIIILVNQADMSWSSLPQEIWKPCFPNVASPATQPS